MNPITKEEVILPRFELESDVKKFWDCIQKKTVPSCSCPITANKAQGQTIPGKMAIYLWDDCFLHGQFNVASSRATYPYHLRYYIKYQRHWDPKCCSTTNSLMNKA